MTTNFRSNNNTKQTNILPNIVKGDNENLEKVNLFKSEEKKPTSLISMKDGKSNLPKEKMTNKYEKLSLENKETSSKTYELDDGANFLSGIRNMIEEGTKKMENENSSQQNSPLKMLRNKSEQFSMNRTSSVLDKLSRKNEELSKTFSSRFSVFDSLSKLTGNDNENNEISHSSSLITTTTTTTTTTTITPTTSIVSEMSSTNSLLGLNSSTNIFNTLANKATSLASILKPDGIDTLINSTIIDPATPTMGFGWENELMDDMDELNDVYSSPQINSDNEEVHFNYMNNNYNQMNKKSNKKFTEYFDPLEELTDAIKGRLQVKIEAKEYELRVWVMGAVSLPKSAVSGMMLDVFCRITLFSERKLLSSRKTKTLKQTCDPVWNQKFAFSPIPEKDVESTEINFAVWDTKLSEENPSKIGCAQIPLKIFTSAPIDAGALWLDLVDKSSPKSKSSGNIDGKKELSLSSSLSESSDEVEEDTKELNAKSLNSADQFLQRLNELKLKLSSKNSITTTTTNVQDTLTTTTITTTETSKLVTSILTQSADKRIGNLLNSSPSISKNSSTISSISFPKPKENIILPSTISNDQKMDDKFHQKRIDVTSHLSEKKFENLNERKFDNFKILNLSTQKMKFEPKSTEIIKSSKVNEEEKRKKYLANLAKFDYGDDEELLEMNFNSAPTSIPTPSDISKDEIDERSQLLEKLMNNKSNEFFKKLEGQNDQFRFDLNKPLPIKIRINENLEKSFQNETTKNFMRKNTPNVMNIPNLDDDIIRSWNRYFYKDLYSKQTDLIRYENESICPSSLLEPSTSNKETQSNLQSFSVETTKYEIEREPDPIPIKIIEEKEDEIKKEIIKPIEPVPVEVVVEEISEPPVIPTTSKVRPNISSKRPSNSSSKADLISRSSIESNQEPVKQSVTKVPVIRKVVKKSMSTTKPINSGKQVEKKVQENKLVQKSSHTTTNIKGILSTSNGSIASKGKPRQEIKRTEIGNRKKDLSKKNVVGNSQQQLDNISINSKTGINRTKMRRIPKGNGTSFSKEVSNDTISMTSLKSNKQKKTVEVRKKTPIDNKRKYGKNIRQFSKHESNSSLDQTNNLVDTSLPSTIIGNVTSKSVNVTKAPRLLSPYPHVQTCSSNVVSSEFFTSPTTTTTTPTTILSNISIGLEKKSNNDVTSTSIAMQRKEFNQFMSETYSNKKPIPIITEKMTSTTTAAYFRPIKFNELTPRNSEDTLLEGSVDTSKSTSSKSTLPILQTNQQPNIGNILTNPIQPPQLIGQKPNEQQYGNVSQQNMISMQMTNSTIVPPSSMINKFVPTPNLNTTTMITTTTTMKISNMNNYPEIFPANMSMNENIQTNQYQLTNNQKMNNVPMTMMMMTTTTNLPQNIVNSFQQMSAPSPAVVVATTMNVQTGGHIAKPTLSRRRSRKEMMETYDKICKYQPPSIKNKSNVILPKAPLGFKTLNPYTGRSKAHPHVIKTHPYELHTSDDFCIEDLLLNNELTLKHQTSLSRSNTHSAIFDKDNNVWGDSTNVTSSKLIEDIKVFKEKHRNKVRLREQQQKQQANVKGMGGNMMRHRMTPNHLGGKRKDQMLNATRRSSQKSNVISLALNEKQIMENQELVENINIPAAVPGEGDAGLIKAGILGGHDPLRQKKLRAHRELKVQQQIQAQKKLQMIHSQSESLAKSKKLGAQKSMDKNAMIEADPFGQIVPDPKSRNKHKGKNAAGLDGPDNMIRPITSTTNTQIGAVTGYLSDTAATATSTAPNTKGKRRTSVAKALVILGINKKSQSASNLGQRRLGFNRTEEIGIPDKLMSRSLSRTTSQSSEGSDISSILKDAMLREDESVTEFVDGLGPGQIISRQALASPCLGKIQLKFIESGLPPTQLRCEIVRAKDMALKPSIKQLPIITAKLYLFDGKNCTEKLKATANERTTEPSFRYGHDFVDTDWRYRVLHIAITGDYGKLDRNSFMGVAQVLMNDLAVDLNSNVKKTLLSWFPLFTQSSLVAVPNFSTTAPGAMGSALNSAITGGGTTVGISSSNSTVGFGRMNNKNAKKHLRRTAMEIEQEKNDKIANDINLQTEFAKSSKVANML
ncbi:hypothetical protein SNEBB_001824 [Seison nebaliae]|nr:hypothetical protein SNEBB_001824 [Seison nebaliae]